MNRILLVTRNFPPLVGGMERLLHHAYLELSAHYRMAVVGPVGCDNHLQPGTPVLPCSALPPARFLTCCQWQTYRLARLHRPHLILSGSGVTAPATRSIGLGLGIPVICFLHGLDIVAPNPIYRIAFLPAVRSCTALLVNSRHTARLARQAGIAEARIRILFPGVAVEPTPRNIDSAAFRTRIGAGTRPILLSVGRLTRRKGVVEFIARSLPQVVAKSPECLYVIIGHEANESLGGSQTVIEQIWRAAVDRGLAGNIRLLGQVDDSTLWEAYAASQVLVFPVIDQPGDVEGFGMVALEAASYGVATVGFATGGIVDAVQDGVSGYLARPGDYQRLSRLIIEHLQAPSPTVTSQSCLGFARQFSWEHFGQQLRQICETVISQPRSERPRSTQPASRAC